MHRYCDRDSLQKRNRGIVNFILHNTYVHQFYSKAAFRRTGISRSYTMSWYVRKTRKKHLIAYVDHLIVVSLLPFNFTSRLSYSYMRVEFFILLNVRRSPSHRLSVYVERVKLAISVGCTFHSTHFIRTYTVVSLQDERRYG